jgi:hypothetical protein
MWIRKQKPEGGLDRNPIGIANSVRKVTYGRLASLNPARIFGRLSVCDGIGKRQEKGEENRIPITEFARTLSPQVRWVHTVHHVFFDAIAVVLHLAATGYPVFSWDTQLVIIGVRVQYSM